MLHIKKKKSNSNPQTNIQITSMQITLVHTQIHIKSFTQACIW